LCGGRRARRSSVQTCGRCYARMGNSQETASRLREISLLADRRTGPRLLILGAGLLVPQRANQLSWSPELLRLTAPFAIQVLTSICGSDVPIRKAMSGSVTHTAGSCTTPLNRASPVALIGTGSVRPGR
jgi:hypothetical protein